MADVLIHGMEMPESCSDCFLDYDSIVCMALNKEFPDRSTDVGFHAYCSSRMPDCPLIELQPHGRLIDADALILEKPDLIHRGLCFGGGYRLPEEIIESATIVEASEVE